MLVTAEDRSINKEVGSSFQYLLPARGGHWGYGGGLRDQVQEEGTQPLPLSSAEPGTLHRCKSWLEWVRAGSEVPLAPRPAEDTCIANPPLDLPDASYSTWRHIYIYFFLYNDAVDFKVNPLQADEM